MFFLLACLVASVMGSQPNFILLFLDDHGWGDFGANWPSTTETPHMDALASDGIRLTDFHVAYSVCTPSRAGLLTGRLAPRTGVSSNFGPTSIHGLALTELTMANILNNAGYDSHMIGKWHLGHNAPFHPTYRGFKSYLGLPYSGDMGCLDSTPQGCKPDWDRTKGQPACPALCPPDNSTTMSETAIPLYLSVDFNCSGHNCSQDIIEQPFNPFMLNHKYAQRAVNIIKNYSNTDIALQNSPETANKPFFLYVAFAHTHTPLAYDNSRFENASTRPGWYKMFGNTLAEVDDAIGQIIRAVDDFGLSESTLIVMTADNGPADLGSVACEAIGSPGPFTGTWQKSKEGGGGGGTCKSTVWEGGHRMLGVARWKGQISPGQVSPALVSSTDLLPTFAVLAGTSLPDDRSYDGIDISQLLLNGSIDGHQTLYHPHGSGDKTKGVPAMRYGKFKAHFITFGSKPCRLPNGTHLPHGPTKTHSPPLLFNLESDPSESVPVVGSSDLYANITAAFDSWWLDVTSTLRSVTKYDKDSKHRPCSNPHSSCCRKPSNRNQL